MPSFAAFVVATLVAHIVRGALPAPEGVPLPLLIAGVVWLVVFYFVRRWLTELRPDV
jgi:hypothetical protein